MGSVQKSSKKKRAHKVSRGIHGGGGKVRPRLSQVERVLLGGGMLHSRVRYPVPKSQKQ